MIDPVSLAITAGITGLNYLMDDSDEIAAEQLAFQRQQAARQERFAQAARTDAFGNVQRYNSATNTWETILTPMQRALMQLREGEESQRLGVDAGRDRDIRRRAFERGVGAEEDYNRALTGYRFDQPPSEASIRDEVTQLMLGSMGEGERLAENLLGRERIRQRGNLPVVNSRDRSDTAGQKLAQVMLQARQQAMGEKFGRDQAHASKYIPAMEHFSRTASGGSSGGVSTESPVAAALAGQQGQMASNLLGAIDAGSKNVGAAYNAQLKAADDPFIDMGDFARMYSSLSGGQQPGPSAKDIAKYFAPGTNFGSALGQNIPLPRARPETNYPYF